MITKKIKASKINKPHHLFNSLNQYIVKIDYFDQKGIKTFEDNIPLKYIFNSEMKLPETNIN